MLRCCRGGGDRDRRPSDGDRWRRNGWRSVSRRGDSSAAADDQRQKYRRVSARTLSSVELAIADNGRLHDGTTATAVPATAGPDASAGLADCCWRSLTGRLTGGGGGCAAQRDHSGGGGGAHGGHGDGSATTPLHGRGGQQRPSGTPTALSNWTMISNSSLKDVDGDELRAELVGYDDDPTTTTTSATADYEDAVKPVRTVNQYY